MQIKSLLTFQTGWTIAYRPFINSLARSGSFTQDTSFVFIGKAFILIITIVSSPILTRLYSPSEYGFFSQFSLYVTNFSLIAGVGYPLAITIVNDDFKFKNLFILSLLISIISLILFTSLVTGNLPLIVPDNFPQPMVFFIFLIFGSLVYSLMQIFPRWNVYKQQFKRNSIINASIMFGGRVAAIGFGLFPHLRHIGLIAGETFGKLLGLIISISRKQFPSISWMKKEFSIGGLVQTSKEFSHYPKYILWSNLISAIGVQIPLFLFSSKFSSEVLGSYALALGVINLPIQLIANSAGPVFLKKLVYMNDNEPGQTKIFYLRLIGILISISILPFFLLVFFSNKIFVFAFGTEWRLAGIFASYLSIIGVLELLTSTISGIHKIFRKEKFLFRFSLMQLVGIITLCIPGLILKDPVIVIIGFVLARLIFSIQYLTSATRLVNVKISDATSLLAILYFTGLFVLVFLKTFSA